VSNLETVRTPSQNSAESSAAAEEWKTTFRPLFAVSFCGACLGVLALLIMFHAPAVNVPIFFFTTRPAMVWFGMLLPFLIVGALGVRRRWFVLGCAFWIVSLLACEDALAWVRPFHESARTKFEASQMAYLSFSKTHGNDIKILDVPLRIVSWNMDAGRMGAAQAVTQLASLRPDLALLEEFAWGEHAAMFDRDVNGANAALGLDSLRKRVSAVPAQSEEQRSAQERQKRDRGGGETQRARENTSD